MKNKLIIFEKNAIEKRDAEKITKLNETTVRYGLTLTQKQALEIVAVRNAELRYNGRIEYGEGIIGKLIKAFCDSPYITQQNYQDTLESLIEIFYYYKNETDDKLSDDELIDYMADFFNGSCKGSVELLATREMEDFARGTRSGRF